MLITFTGRKSGKQFTTPVRYVRSDNKVYAFTAKENQWWRNLRGGADVVLRTRGQDAAYRAVAIDDDPQTIREWLIKYLGQFPQDAVYHDIRLNKDKSLNAADLERAVPEAVVVEATPL
jgi:deazaflavin-dependent oxidoreductase (nitroreductase family)